MMAYYVEEPDEEAPRKAIFVDPFNDNDEEDWEVKRFDLTEYLSTGTLPVDEHGLADWSVVSKGIREKSGTDVTLRHCRQTIKCHAAVLRYYCHVIDRDLPAGALILVRRNAVGPAICSLTYEWMSNESIQCPRSNLVDLMAAASHWQIPKLASAVFDVLDDKRIFSTDESVLLYFQAQKTRVACLGTLMLTEVGKHFLLIVHSNEFRELGANALATLISGNLLFVQTEVEVLYATFIWLYADYEKRIKEMPQVLNSVRFQLLPPPFLFTTALMLGDLDAALANIIYPSMMYAMLQQQELVQCNINAADADDLKYWKLESDRSWIVDPECPYRQEIECGKFIDHDVFIKYVASLDNAGRFKERIYEKNASNRLQISETSESKTQILTVFNSSEWKLIDGVLNNENIADETRYNDPRPLLLRGMISNSTESEN